MTYSPGDLLVRDGAVSQQMLRAALARRDAEGGSLGENLVALGAIDEEKLASFYHRRLVLPRIADERLTSISPAVLRLVPAEVAAEFRVVPIAIDNDGALLVAMADPSDNHAVEEIGFFVDRFILRGVATESALRRAIAQHYPQTAPAQPAVDFDLSIVVEPDEPEPVPAEEPVVILTRKKAPDPVPPPPEEPLLLTRRRQDHTETLPGIAPKTWTAPLPKLRAANDRDLVAKLLLDYASLLLGRAALFVVRRGALVGFDVRGQDLERASIELISVPLGRPSLFDDVVRSRLPFRGAIPDTPQNRALQRALDTAEGADVLVCPVLVRDRVVAVLFGDRVSTALPEAELQSVLYETGRAYERILLAARGTTE